MTLTDIWIGCATSVFSVSISAALLIKIGQLEGWFK